MNIKQDLEKVLLRDLKREKKPQLVIIDGVDGVGKTSIVKKLIEQLEKEGDKVIFNTFKRKREDKEEFLIPSEEYEWKFRKEVVEQINRRLVTYTDEDWIIVDKSPYSEYFYQKTKEFDRGLILPHGNHEIEKEIFRHKEIVDNAIVIFLENKECWNNYYNREVKKQIGSTSYEMLSEKDYKSMAKTFEDHQHVYNDTQKYSKIEIKNDTESWKRVYGT